MTTPADHAIRPVPALDVDDAECLPINEDEVEPAPRTRRVSRYEFALPPTSERSPSHAGVVDGVTSRASLPVWSPQEEQPRAAGG